MNINWCMHPTLALVLLLVASVTSAVAAVLLNFAGVWNWILSSVSICIVAVFFSMDPVHVPHQRFQPGRAYFHTKPREQQCQDDWYVTFMDHKTDKNGKEISSTMDVTIQVRKAGTDHRENEGVYVVVLDYEAHVMFYYRFPLESFAYIHPRELETSRDFAVAFNNSLRECEVVEWSSSRIRMKLHKDRYCGDTLFGDVKNHARILEVYGGVPDVVEIDVEYSNTQAKNHPYNWFQQGIMGFGALIPFQTFVADALISNSTVSGSVKYTNNKTNTATTQLSLQPSTSRLYMEKYYGTGFPKSWMWGGCQLWEGDPSSFVSFVYGFVYEEGKMPMAGWSFGLQIGHHQWHSFSPTHFGSLQALELTDDGNIRNIHCQAQDGNGYAVVFDVKGCRKDKELEVYGIQDDGFQPGYYANHGTTGTLRVSLYDKKGRLVWTGKSLSFACEFSGDYQGVYEKALQAKKEAPLMDHPSPEIAETIRKSRIGKLDLKGIESAAAQETTPLSLLDVAPQWTKEESAQALHTV